MSTNIFEVDRQGLAQILERRGKAFAITELWQNAVDEASGHVMMVMEPVPGRSLIRLYVEDDSPAGWTNLADAYTLFGPSYKKADPTKAGRFNLGEKLVIAISVETTISTMNGTLRFTETERKEFPRRKRERGSAVEAWLRMTRAEYEEALAVVKLLIPPEGVEATFNGEAITRPPAVAMFDVPLTTEFSDDEGYLRRSRRITSVHVYEPLGDEPGRVFELGIPVAESGDRWDVDVRQKVPLNLERDGVPPAFLRDLRAHVLNHTTTLLTRDDTAEDWVSDAMADDNIAHDTVEAVLDLRYGEKRVVFDPSDHEANRTALSQGYTVIPPRAFSKSAWANIRGAEAVRPAGQVLPSPKPFHPDGSDLDVIDPKDYTDDQQALVEFVEHIHRQLVGRPIHVVLTADRGWQFNGSYGGGRIVLNVGRLAADPHNARTLALVLHEFAHSRGEHLTHEFDSAIARFAAELIQYALTTEGRAFFDRYSVVAAV